MANYKCPDCPTFTTQQWGLLKGHLMRKHQRSEFTDVKDASGFAEFEISDEEYANLRSASGSIPVDTGSEGSGDPPPPVNQKARTIETPPPVEPISEYVGEPVSRLRQILLVNGGQPSIVETVTKIMALNKWLWNNPDQIEAQLMAHFGQSKKAWIQACVTQYWRGVELPRELKGGGNPYYTQGNPYGGPGYGYQGGYQNPPAGWNQNLGNPEVQELKAEVTRMREERQAELRRQEQQVLLDRIAKLESGGSRDPVLARLEAIEKQITGGGMPTTMTIYDEKGHPMVLPYDRSFQDAMTRKAEAETKLQEFNQMLAMMGNRGGMDEATKAQMKRLEDATADANKRVEDLVKAMTDQRMAQLEAAVKNAQDRAKAAEEAAAAGTGETKGVLDFASEAAGDMREGAAEIAKQVKEGVSESIEKLGQIITNHPITTTPAVQRTPEEIADIMDAENTFLGSIGEK